MTTGGRPKILCVGIDPLLNRTRRFVLEKCFEVHVAGNTPEAFALLKAWRFDVVLLCYSLTDDECRKAVEFIHSLVASPRILVLAQGRQRLPLGSGDEEFVSGGPAELLAKAASMADVNPDDLKAQAG